MSHRFRDLLPPSVGDSLLRGATSAKVTLSRWPAIAEADGDDLAQIDCEFELHGQIPLTADNADELLTALIHEFRTPRQPRQSEGGAAC